MWLSRDGGVPCAEPLRWEGAWPAVVIEAARVAGEWGARRKMEGEATEAVQLQSHGHEGPGKDFEPHPKKQKAVERFLAEEYHDLISAESDLAF